MLTNNIQDAQTLNKAAAEAPDEAQLVELRYFAGLSLEESAQAMGISEATARRYWAFARAWLFRDVRHPDASCRGSKRSSENC